MNIKLNQAQELGAIDVYLSWSKYYVNPEEKLAKTQQTNTMRRYKHKTHIHWFTDFVEKKKKSEPNKQKNKNKDTHHRTSRPLRPSEWQGIQLHTHTQETLSTTPHRQTNRQRQMCGRVPMLPAGAKNESRYSLAARTMSAITVRAATVAYFTLRCTSPVSAVDSQAFRYYRRH